MRIPDAALGRLIASQHRRERWFRVLAASAVVFALLVLVVFLADVFADGVPRLNWQFLTSFPSRKPEQAGILAALAGSVYLVILTAALAVPLGIGAAVYLEEYARDNFFTRLIEVNIANLAGVPSIIYGILGLELFVRFMVLERSLIAGALTMALLILPIVILASREALRAVPKSLREASYALGATRWQTTRHHVLPLALPGMLTGIILALSRAIGETAPLIMLGALTYVAFLPTGLKSPFTALAEFAINAAAGIVVLLIILLSMNAIAIWLRNKYQRKYQW